MKQWTPEELMERVGGMRSTSRMTRELSEDGKAVSTETIRAGLRGIRVWSAETRQRLARAWGVGVDEVIWPLEDGEPGPQKRVVFEGGEVFVTTEDTPGWLVNMLEGYAHQHPEQVRLLTPGEMRAPSEAPELEPAELPVTWTREPATVTS